VDWDSVGFVKASPVRVNIINKLSEKPMSPKELTKSLAIHFPQVSLALKQLTERGITICLTDSRLKGRLYGLTDLGQSIIKML